MVFVPLATLLIAVQFNGGDESLVANIQLNTPRYVTHFEAAVDRLMPPPHHDKQIGNDVFDILQVICTQNFFSYPLSHFIESAA